MATLQETLDAFVQFVQAELFRRPFLNNDPNQESIMVRRGGGPRQLTGLDIADDQVIGRVNGQIVGIPVGEVGGGAADRKFLFEQSTAATQWTINHSYNSTNLEVYVVDENNSRILPDDITSTTANTVVITFTKEQAGKAILRWYD